MKIAMVGCWGIGGLGPYGVVAGGAESLAGGGLSPDSVVRGKEKQLSARVCVGLRLNRFFGFIR